MVKPKITILQKDFYCEQTDIVNPYNLKKLAGITAFDSTGKDISESISIDSYKVDYRKVGDYLVNITAMDSQFNMSVSSLIVHVVPAESDKRKRKKNQTNSLFEVFDKLKKMSRKQKLGLALSLFGLSGLIVGTTIVFLDMFG